MTIFEDIEKRLETLVESFFGRQFPSPLQPVEIAKRMAKEMDRNRKVGTAETYAPNKYSIEVSPSDYETLGGLAQSLSAEFRGYLLAHAKRKGYTLAADVSVVFVEKDDMDVGMLRVEADYSERPSRAKPTGSTQVISAEEAANLGLSLSGNHSYLMDIASGSRYELSGDLITIGRDSDSSVVLTDPSVSRHQSEMRREGPVFVIRDLNSTNGTLVNDKPVDQAVLEDEDRITLGTVTLVFRSRL